MRAAELVAGVSGIFTQLPSYWCYMSQTQSLGIMVEVYDCVRSPLSVRALRRLCSRFSSFVGTLLYEQHFREIQSEPSKSSVSHAVFPSLTISE